MVAAGLEIKCLVLGEGNNNRYYVVINCCVDEIGRNFSSSLSPNYLAFFNLVVREICMGKISKKPIERLADTDDYTQPSENQGDTNSNTQQMSFEHNTSIPSSTLLNLRTSLPSNLTKIPLQTAEQLLGLWVDEKWLDFTSLRKTSLRLGVRCYAELSDTVRAYVTSATSNEVSDSESDGEEEGEEKDKNDDDDDDDDDDEEVGSKRRSSRGNSSSSSSSSNKKKKGKKSESGKAAKEVVLPQVVTLR